MAGRHRPGATCAAIELAEGPFRLLDRCRRGVVRARGGEAGGEILRQERDADGVDGRAHRRDLDQDLPVVLARFAAEGEKLTNLRQGQSGRLGLGDEAQRVALDANVPIRRTNLYSPR